MVQTDYKLRVVGQVEIQRSTEQWSVFPVLLCYGRAHHLFRCKVDCLLLLRSALEYFTCIGWDGNIAVIFPSYQ